MLYSPTEVFTRNLSPLALPALPGLSLLYFQKSNPNSSCHWSTNPSICLLELVTVNSKSLLSSDSFWECSPHLCTVMKTSPPWRTVHPQGLLRWWLLPPPSQKALGLEVGYLPFYSLLLFPNSCSYLLALKKFLVFWRIILGYHPSLHHMAGIHNPSSHLSVFTESFSTSLLPFRWLHVTQWLVIIAGLFCFRTAVSSHTLKSQFLYDLVLYYDLVLHYTQQPTSIELVVTKRTKQKTQHPIPPKPNDPPYLSQFGLL